MNEKFNLNLPEVTETENQVVRKKTRLNLLHGVTRGK